MEREKEKKDKDRNKNSAVKYFFKKSIGTFVAFFAISIIIILVALYSLRLYTRHGEGVYVPKLRGMDLELAQNLIKKSDLKYEIIDSLYVAGAKPGSIIDVIPEENAKVKKGRVLYLRIQGYGKRMVSISPLKGFSERQAMTTLKSLGFRNIDIKSVDGEYKDLVIELLSDGKVILETTKIPIDSKITLVIENGIVIDEEENDYYDGDQIYGDTFNNFQNNSTTSSQHDDFDNSDNPYFD